MAAQPRRRPSFGGTKRSINGDHRNLNVHGACARVMSPTMRMSIPDLRIQSGMAIHTSPSGMPEAKDISVTEAVRQEVNAWPRLWKVEGFLAGAVVNQSSSVSSIRTVRTARSILLQHLHLRPEPHQPLIDRVELVVGRRQAVPLGADE